MADLNKAFEFGPFRLEVRERRLTREGYTVPLRGRVFDTLHALVSRHGCLVTKDELMAIVWPDSVVEESNLNHNICILRRALGEKVTGQKYVETVPRQGYRFVADVREFEDVETSGSFRVWDIHEDMLDGAESRGDSPLSPHSSPFPTGKSSSAPGPRFLNRLPWYRHQGVIPSLAVILLLVFGYFGLEQLTSVQTPSNSRVMLAVLPFENLTGDPGEKYVADGLTHEIIAQLGTLNTPSVGVIASTSSRLYQDARKSISQIGRELGVAYVIEGSLRRNRNSYRITVLLIRVEDQAHLWASSYTRTVGNVTNLQEEIAKNVITEIGRRIDVKRDEGYPTACLQSLENTSTQPHSFHAGQRADEAQAVSTRPLAGG